MQTRIDASIQRNAPQEELVDDPVKEPRIVRVSGPFTMESIPHPAEISLEVEHERIPGDGDSEWELTILSPAESSADAANASAYVGDMIEKLRKTGVHLRGGRKVDIENLRALDHEIVHAEGDLILPNGGNEPKRLACAVVFGPQNGAVTETHVRDAVRAARPYDAILFCGYDISANAQEMIQSDPVPGKRMLMAYVSPDTAMTDLLKDTKASQIFTMVGEPDVVVYRHADASLPQLLDQAEQRDAHDVAVRAAELRPGEMFVELRGVDLYDPVTGEVQSDQGQNVHAFLIDQNYDGKSFCICQALFPNRRDSWDKIARNLKGTVDEDAFEAMRTLVSLPFLPGDENRIQIKVIDARGNAVVKTVRI